MSSLWSAFADVAARYGRNEAIFWEGRWLRYADLERLSASSGSALIAAGVRRGDRVAVALPNSSTLVACLLGTLRIGAVYVPLNPAYTAEEASYIIEASDARVAIVHDALREAIAARRSDLSPRIRSALVPSSDEAPPVVVGAEAPALIVYTSGTTGRPKGAILSHRALLSNLSTVASAWEWCRQDRLLLTLPCSHLHGLGLGLLASFIVGSSLVLRPRFVSEEALGDLERHRVTMFFGVPTMYNRLVHLSPVVIAAADLRRMRVWVSGSAPLLAATSERFRELFGHSILERFGMSEGGFMIASPLRGPRRPGVVGTPLPGVEIRLVDEDAADRGEIVDAVRGTAGEVLIRGANLFSGYWQDPEATRAAFLDGYFRSGDLAVCEPDGMLRIVGRKSIDIIKTRGYKVSAVEIENRLQACSGVREVAVIGVPHADWGEAIIAVVVPSSSTHDEQALLEQARQDLAPYKVPSRIVFVDDIPKIGPGKFRKKDLKRLVNLDGLV